MQYRDPPFYPVQHAPLPRMARPSLPTPWEPYRPRRLPWRGITQVAAAGLFLAAAVVSLV